MQVISVLSLARIWGIINQPADGGSRCSTSVFRSTVPSQAGSFHRPELDLDSF